MVVTHFLTQYTHVCRHLGVNCRKQKKKNRDNCFESVVSDLKEKLAYVSTKLLLEKSVKTKKNEKKTMKTFTIFGGFWGHNYFFW